jgi:arsenate reductase
MSKTRVLFLCTGNSARSQMGEALLRFHAGDDFDVYSAGLAPSKIHPLTIQVLDEIGVSTKGQYSKDVSEYLGKLHFGYLITVCSDADRNCPTTFPGIGQRMHWGFDDPVAFEGTDADKLAKFRNVRDEIDQKIQAWLAQLAAERLIEENSPGLVSKGS